MNKIFIASLFLIVILGCFLFPNTTYIGNCDIEKDNNYKPVSIQTPTTGCYINQFTKLGECVPLRGVD